MIYTDTALDSSPVPSASDRTPDKLSHPEKSMAHTWSGRPATTFPGARRPCFLRRGALVDTCNRSSRHKTLDALAVATSAVSEQQDVDAAIAIAGMAHGQRLEPGPQGGLVGDGGAAIALGGLVLGCGACPS